MKTHVISKSGLNPLAVAVLAAIASSSAFALTDAEWNALPQTWKDFHLWTSGGVDHTGAAELVLDKTTLTSSLSHGDFRDAVIGLVNYSGSSYGEMPGDVTVSLPAREEVNTLAIDMDGNPHAGILVARTSTDRVASWTGHPSLTINAALNISGNVSHQKATDVGDFTAGIAVGLGEVHVLGDLNINLSGMDSQSSEERRPVPNDGKWPLWQQYYGWTVFDDRRGSGNESNLIPTNTSYLLQGGVVTGIAAVSVDGNADIEVSGRNGVLGGWIMAPNVELWQETDEWGNVAPVVVDGDLRISAALEENSKAFGLFGLGLQASGGDDDRIEMTFNVSGDAVFNIDGRQSEIEPIWEKGQIEHDSTKMLELGNAEALLLHGSHFRSQSIDVNVRGVKRAFYAGGIDVRNNASVQTGNVNVDVLLPSSEVTTAFGIYGVNNPRQASSFGDVTIDVKANAENIYGLLWNGSSLTLTGNTQISASRLDASDARKEPAYAVVADNGITDTEVHLKPDAGKTLCLTGDLWVTANNAALHADFGEGSYLRGAARVDLYEDMSREELADLFARYAGLWVDDLSLTFRKGAFWDVTGHSQVTHLNLSEGAKIILANHNEEDILPETGVLPGFGSHILDIRHFTGVSVEDKANAGIFHLDVNLDTTEGVANKGGFITFFDTVDADKPYAVLEIASTGAWIAERSKALVLDSTPEQNLQIELVHNPIIGRRAEIGAYLYELTRYEDASGEVGKAFSDYFMSSEHADEYGEKYFAEQGDDYYYLQRTGETSPTADDTASVASFGLQIAQYLAHLDTLRERLGDIRYDGERGAWARATVTKDRLKGVGGAVYTTETSTLMFGADTQLGRSLWTAGVLARFLDSNGEGSGRTNIDADGQGAGATLYATHQSTDAHGAYVDLTASFDWYDQDLDGVMADGVTRYEGSYSTTAWGVSAETGFQWRWGQAQTWFIEPSVQLSYYAVDGERFKLSNGMVLNQDNAESLTGRVGAAFGYTSWLDGKRDMEVYGKLGVNHEFLGEEDLYVNDAHYNADIMGTRLYYGLGLTKALNSDTVFWVQFSREEGEDYTREYAGNVGIRWNF